MDTRVNGVSRVVGSAGKREEDTTSTAAKKSQKAKRKVTEMPDNTEIILETAIKEPSVTQAKTSGAVFGEMVAHIYDKIPGGYRRDMMKMDVMKLMYEVPTETIR